MIAFSIVRNKPYFATAVLLWVLA